MKTLIAPALVFLLLPAVPAAADIITSNWNGGSSGTHDWEINANWTPSVGGKPYPNNGTDAYLTNIGDATGDRVIQTTGPITVSRLKITQSSATGSNTLALGGNLTVLSNFGLTADNGFINSTNNASRLVIDLAGHNLTVEGVPGTGLTDNTWFTLTGGGRYQTTQFYNNASGNIAVGNGVTVKVVGTGAQSVFRTTWSTSSTFQFAANSATLTNITGRPDPTFAFGNLVIGDASNTVASSANLLNTTTGNGIFVKGNVDILTYAGSGGASAKLGIGTGKLNVSGNFIDQGTDSFSYGTGTIIFDGGIGTERTLSTGRTGLATGFQVGRTVSTPGNIVLGKDLETTGSFTVLKESRLNVDHFTLEAGSFDLQSTLLVDPTVAFTFGESASGLISVAGELKLSLATINVTFDGSGWTHGDDLILFEFGTLTGTPDLTVNVFGGFAYDQLVVGPNSIYLTNVVPEPASAVLLLVGAGLLLSCRGKRLRRAV